MGNGIFEFGSSNRKLIKNGLQQSIFPNNS